MAEPIPGLRVVRHNASCIDQPEDPNYPYKLEMRLSPPAFMNIAFICMVGGSEDLVVQAMTREAMDELIVREDYRTHPRLRWLKVTGPEGIIEEMNR